MRRASSIVAPLFYVYIEVPRQDSLSRTIGVTKRVAKQRLLALVTLRLLRPIRDAKGFLSRERNIPSLCIVLTGQLLQSFGFVVSNVVVYREVQGVSIHAVSNKNHSISRTITHSNGEMEKRKVNISALHQVGFDAQYNTLFEQYREGIEVYWD